jgi:acetoin utilization protein AcuB
MTLLSVEQIMKRPVISVRENENLADAYRVMCDYDCRHVPVVNDEREVVGVISDSDILKSMSDEGIQLSQLAEQELLLRDHPVTEVMSTNPETIEVGLPLADACQIMLENKIDCLPVTEGRHLAGIITTSDILRAMIQRETEE